MLFKNSEPLVAGDAAWRSRERLRRRRELVAQVGVAVVFLALLWLLAANVTENLAARNIQNGFGFLENSAGFEIGESMLPFTSSDSFFRAFEIGVLNTLKVSVLSIFTATLLGIVVAFMKISRQPVIRFLGWAHVEVYRNIPLIVGLLAVYTAVTELLPDMEAVVDPASWVMLDKAGLQFAVPVYNGWACLVALLAGLVSAGVVRRLVAKISTFLVAWISAADAFAATAAVVWLAWGVFCGWEHPQLEGFTVEGGGAITPEFLALWVGLTLFSSAPIAEVIRAGVLSVSHGQWDSAMALGLTRVQAASYVIFPQAMRLSIPPLASQFMNLTKNSSLAVVVGYPDVVCIGNTSINSTGQALEMICLIMLVYLILNLVTSVIMNAVNAEFTRAGVAK